MPAPNKQTDTEPTPRPRRWLRRLGLILVLVFTLVVLAPNLIAWTSLTNTLVQCVMPDLYGKVTIGSASLGWFSSVELHDITVTDSSGNNVATVPRLTSSRTLLGLAMDQTDLGEFSVERPTLNLVAEENTTNLEGVLANLLKPSDRPASSPPVLRLRVTEGVVHLRDVLADRTTTLEKADVLVVLPADHVLTANVSARISGDHPGKIDASATLATDGQAKITLDAFPLEVIMPVIRRFEPGTSLSGQLTGEANVTWGGELAQPTLTLVGDLHGRDFVLASPRLQGDKLRLTKLDLPLDVTTEGSRITINKADLTCDVGSVSAKGTLDTTEPLDRLLTRDGLRLDSEIDLARLAQMMPHVLTLREGTSVTEGKLIVKLSSQGGQAVTVWNGEVQTSALKAQRDGRPLRWDEPLTLSFTSRMRPGELPTFDRFVCRSEFLTATASGSAEALEVKADLSMDRLVQRLEDFVDLGGVKLAGSGKLVLEADRTPAGALHATASLEMSQFSYADLAGRVLNEPAMKVSFDARGLLLLGKPFRLDSGKVSVSAGSDLFSATLREPLNDPSHIDRVVADVSLAGDMARWQARAARLVTLPRDLHFAGSGTITGLATYTPGRIRVDKLALDLERAGLRGFGLNVDEPQVVASAESLTIDLMSNKVEATKTLLSCATVGANAPRMLLEPTAGGYLVVTAGSIQADLGRVQRTLQMQTDPRGGDAWAGVARGTFRCRAEGAKTQFGTDLDVQNFVYGSPQAPFWSEAQVKLTTSGSVDLSSETVQLESFRLGRDALQIDAQGRLSRWSSTRDVDMSGTLTYDLARLTPQFREMLGSGFQATGQAKRDFTVKGPLASLRDLTANATVGWQSVRAYGLDVGAGELTARLANGVLTSNAIEATFAGGSGKARVQPTVRLDPAPQLATIAPGRIIDRAQLTPQATAQALGYALPPIANSTNAEGEFSFVLEENQIPLAAPTQASLRGRLEIHRAVVSASPLAAEIARLLKANQTSVTLAKDNIIPIRVENGRVHHENLTLTVNNFTLKTRGSVGLDGSLSLVAEVPAPAGLLNSNPKVAQALAGRMIPVPIGGTLTQPRLDPVAFQREVARMTAEIVQETIRDTGRDLLNRELEKVLPPGGEKGKLPPLPGLEKLLPKFPRR